MNFDVCKPPEMKEERKAYSRDLDSMQRLPEGTQDVMNRWDEESYQNQYHSGVSTGDTFLQ